MFQNRFKDFESSRDESARKIDTDNVRSIYHQKKTYQSHGGVYNFIKLCTTFYFVNNFICLYPRNQNESLGQRLWQVIDPSLLSTRYGSLMEDEPPGFSRSYTSSIHM